MIIAYVAVPVAVGVKEANGLEGFQYFFENLWKYFMKIGFVFRGERFYVVVKSGPLHDIQHADIIVHAVLAGLSLHERGLIPHKFQNTSFLFRIPETSDSHPAQNHVEGFKKGEFDDFFLSGLQIYDLLHPILRVGHAETPLLFVTLYKIISASNKNDIATIDGGKIGRVRDNGLQIFQRPPSSILEGRHSMALRT